ncbi:MAG TPA: UDP-N-acetylmuramoyl-L-alanine--D-glutamate ligase [Sphingomicrobium sp.]|nr:UDP-N-acetylmuramoyl-L-alanine--D-glutamate ligase [Sphingomicrobium sp.]
MITAKAFSGRHYAVYGLARSGLATVEALLASGATVTAWDATEEARANLPAGAGIANLDQADLTQFNSLVVTPGLPLNRHPIAQRARDAGLEIIGDIELFARARSEFPPHMVVGITGTNGKSTTTALVHHILKTAGVPTTMGGNIGLPILAQEPLPEGGVYVLELSSYQIDLTQSLDCDVAVLLNITPDHLDRYECFDAYAASKARLFQMQDPSNYGLIGTSSAAWGSVFESFPHTCLIALEPWLQELNLYSTLPGLHNLENRAAASYVCGSLQIGLPEAAIERGLQSFPGLPHRMERVAERDGVLFVNDSKATNPAAVAPALAVFPDVRWIVGGQAKSDRLDECAPHFGHVRKAYTIGEAGELFGSLLRPHMAVAECGTLDAAVAEAASDAKAGDTVLLSPACASFDQFRDFEARGDAFRAAVEAL